MLLDAAAEVLQEGHNVVGDAGDPGCQLHKRSTWHLRMGSATPLNVTPEAPETGYCRMKRRKINKESIDAAQRELDHPPNSAQPATAGAREKLLLRLLLLLAA